MKRHLLACGLGIILTIGAFAQTPPHRTCGTMDNLNRLQTEDPALALRMQQVEAQTAAYIAAQKHAQNTTNAIITIPVVFHVVYNTTAQNISDAQCQAQLDQLNLDYARLNADRTNTPSVWSTVAVNTNVQFCLAQRTPAGASSTGIERRQTTTTSFSTNDNVKHTSTGGMDAWPAASYLNIWSCNLSGGVLGYAQFPGGSAATDGVVLLYSSIGSVARPGTASPYNLGRTATHEVGHWLNLYHIWGDDGGACTGSDNVSDTPNQAAENYGCPTYPHTDACTGTSPGVMFMNYMDYTDDGCMNMFTAGQSARMAALFSTGGSRVGILSSAGCQPVTGSTCNVPTGMSTTGITTTAATFNWTAASGTVSDSVRYHLTGAATWTTVLSASTSSYSVSSLVATSNYEWAVKTNCSTGGSSWSAAVAFTTASNTSTCNVPSGMNTSAITTTSATFNWTAASGTVSDSVRYHTAGAATWTTVLSASTSSFTVSNLVASTNYEWAVKTNCSGAGSAWSSAVAFTTAAATGTCTNSYEPNDATTTAVAIPVGTDVFSMINPSTDIDYFSFANNSTQHNIKVTLTNLPGDYDIRLYDPTGLRVAISQNAGTTSETIIYNTTTVGTYKVRIYGYGGAYSATQCYDLKALIGSTAFRMMDGTVAETAEAIAVNDFSLFPNPAASDVSLTYNAQDNEKISVRVFDMVGKTIRNDEMNVVAGYNKFSLDLSSLNTGIYFVELRNATDRMVKKLILEK